MSVQDAFIDVIGKPRVSSKSGRQKGSPRSYLKSPAAGGMIMCRDDGRKNLGIEGAAAACARKGVGSAGTASGCR